jgi:hypothetical protein
VELGCQLVHGRNVEAFSVQVLEKCLQKLLKMFFSKNKIFCIVTKKFLIERCNFKERSYGIWETAGLLFKLQLKNDDNLNFGKWHDSF